jgi:hypothetical protein
MIFNYLLKKKISIYLLLWENYIPFILYLIENLYIFISMETFSLKLLELKEKEEMIFLYEIIEINDFLYLLLRNR